MPYYLKMVDSVYTTLDGAVQHPRWSELYAVHMDTPFVTRADAHVVRRDMNAVKLLDIVYEPTYLEKGVWHKRENARFDSCEYLPIPWNADEWYEQYAPIHFAHISIDQPGMVAYTPDAESGIADKQLRTTPGRYLAKYAKQLSKAAIADYVDRVKADLAPLKLATEEKDILWIYAKGPQSCMDGRNFSLTSENHPCKVYAGPDLAVAYMGGLPTAPDTRGVTESADKITARSIVWPEKKIYTRIYGDTTLGVILTRAGYTKGTLDGARLRRIPYKNGRGFLMPYVDAADSVSADGEFWVLHDGDHRRDVGTKETQGYVHDYGECDNDDSDDRPEMISCAHCGVECEDDSDYAPYCEGCHNDRQVCQRCDRSRWDENGGHVAGEWYCDTCFEETEQTCTTDGCSETWHDANLDADERATRERYHVATYCPSCAHDKQTCPDCDTLQERDNLDCEQADCGRHLHDYRCPNTPIMPFVGMPKRFDQFRVGEWFKVISNGNVGYKRSDRYLAFRTMDNGMTIRPWDDPYMSSAAPAPDKLYLTYSEEQFYLDYPSMRPRHTDTAPIRQEELGA